MRDLAGWIRSCRISNSSRSPRLAAQRHEHLAVEHAPVGQLLAHRLDHLGEVAGQRLGVAAGQLDLVAVLEHQAAEAVPLRLEAQAAVDFAGSGIPLTLLASIGRTGGITGRSTGPTVVVEHRRRCIKVE